VKLREALDRVLAPDGRAAMGAAVDMFSGELAAYAELVLGRESDPIGFLTRGEGPSFSQRTQMLVRALGLGDEALAHVRWLDGWFEQRRAFVKLEWHRAVSQPLLAVYYRRRPSVDVAIAAFGKRGVAATVLEDIRETAAILDKKSVHFVAAAMRPGRPLQHKVYFTQYVTPEHAAAAAGRIDAALAHAGVLGATRAQWRAWHDEVTARRAETTVFLSFHFTGSVRLPSIKLDYPEIWPAQVAAWDAATVREAEIACRLTGRDRLSYLGIRLTSDRTPEVKLYADWVRTG
jgi:hypothetical protein